MTIRQGTTIISGGGGKVTSVNGEIGDVVVKSVVNEKDNSTQLKFWLGTQEEYEQITEKDASTLYYTSGEDSSAISYDDLTNKPTINTVPLSGDMTLAELGIQGELQAGTGITIEDNVISATVVGGVTSVNGQTGDVTVEGLKDQNTVNTGLLKFWTGTKEQYAEIETKDPNTLYYVGETLTPATLATVATTGLYADLLEKPQINNVELTGNKTLTELGIAATSDLSTIATSGSYNDTTDKPQINTVTLEGNKTSADLGLQDAETALNYNNITNCITKIPQDIKLELNDGVLTLKAGSKVYVPNGFETDGTTRKFDEIILDKDYNRSITTTSTGYTLLYFNKNNQDDNYKLSSVTVTGDATKWSYSGNTAPTEFISDIAYWYDTQNNIVKNTLNSGSSWEEGFSLPIAVISYEPNTFTSIDQVFNRFGFIGSTIFALPGVEGLIPNGRNTDGSLNNIKVTTNSVCLVTASNVTTDTDIRLYSNQIGIGFIKYDYRTNIVYNNSGSPLQCLQAGKAYIKEGRITSFNPSNTFQAIDRNDNSWIAAQAMPSEKYIDLTLGASGTSYTAPANGWFYLAKSSSAANQFIAMEGNIGMRIFATDINANLPISISCQKGKSIKISYNVGGTTNVFRFVYAEGEL